MSKTIERAAISWQDWNLGGGMMVKAYTDKDRNCVVWYPEGLTDTGAPTLAIFASNDEEWTSPILWTERVTIEEAEAILLEAGQ